eukprot:8353580-Lingulodinium_polyedra.AAC.1
MCTNAGKCVPRRVNTSQYASSRHRVPARVSTCRRVPVHIKSYPRARRRTRNTSTRINARQRV